METLEKMTKKDTYRNRLKKAEKIKKRMIDLKEGEAFDIKYMKANYNISCYIEYDHPMLAGSKGLSVNAGKSDSLNFKSMNIKWDSLLTGGLLVDCYGYDLFGKRTSHRLKLDEIEIINL